MGRNIFVCPTALVLSFGVLQPTTLAANETGSDV